MSESTVVSKGPCPKCGSSDACATYSDGHQHCFSFGCEHHTGGGEKAESAKPRPGLIPYEPTALSKRAITEETCRHFRYGVGTYNGKPCQVATYLDERGAPTAQKIRFANKDFTATGKGIERLLFGAQHCRNGGKSVVITEGEIDAMSMSQVQGNKWPVLSIPTGSTGAAKAIAANVEMLEKFEKVIFMFDSDEPGRKAAIECAEVLSPGKAYIAELPLKDANEMLVAGRVEELMRAMWNAKPYRPDGVVCGADIWDRITNPKQGDELPFPWQSWNLEHLGARTGEIILLTGGTGSGKSTIARQLVAHWHDTHGEIVGIMALEENVAKTAKIIVGMELGRRIHLEKEPGADWKAAFDKTIGSGRYFLFDHWGSLEGDALINKLRYMVKGCGCKTILLDHVSIAISGLDIDDERKATDVLMTRLRGFVEETDCRLIVICHLSRGENNHEGGGEIRLRDLRGSHILGQVSDQVIAIERDQQAEEDSDICRVRWLKDRWTGALGVAGHLKYSKQTGRSTECDKPEEKNDAEQDQADAVSAF